MHTIARALAIVILATSALALSSCGDTQNERWVAVPGTIIMDTASGQKSSVIVPTEGSVGTPIPVVITSFGGGCNRRGQSEVELHDHVARISVIDLELSADDVCTTELKHFIHKVALNLPSAGKWRVEVVGKRIGKGYHLGQPATISNAVTVK